MTSNNQFTSPFEALLRQYVYGEVTVRRFHSVVCEDTCRDWRPFDERVFQARPWESWESFERRFDQLVDEEEQSRICQGHLVLRDTFRGMLRNYTFKPASDDRSRDGSLLITVLPWDDKEQRLTCKRTIKTRIFDYDIQASSLYVVDGDGSSAVELSLSQWRTATT